MRVATGVVGRSCRTDILGVSPSVSDRVFIAVSFRLLHGPLLYRRRGVWFWTPSTLFRVRDAIFLTPSVKPVSWPWPGATCGCRVVVGVESRSDGGLFPCKFTFPGRPRTFEQLLPSSLIIHLYFHSSRFSFGNFVAWCDKCRWFFEWTALPVTGLSYYYLLKNFAHFLIVNERHYFCSWFIVFTGATSITDELT